MAKYGQPKRIRTKEVQGKKKIRRICDEKEGWNLCPEKIRLFTERILSTQTTSVILQNFTEKKMENIKFGACQPLIWDLSEKLCKKKQLVKTRYI